MKKLFLYVFMIMGVQWLHAQTRLTVEAAVKAATDNSRETALATNAYQVAETKFRQTDAIYLPRLSVDYTAMATNNPLNAFGFKLQQRSITQSDFAPDLLNHPEATTNFSTQATLQQPVFNADLLAMRHAARKQVQIAGYQKQRVQEYVQLSTEMEYQQLQLSYEMEKVAQEALVTLQAIYKWTKDRYDQGYVQKSDLLNVDVQVKAVETQIATARSAVQEHSDNLGVWMGQPVGTLYEVDTLALIPANNYEQQLPADRSDFKAMETAIASYADMMKSTRRSAIPKVNGFASWQLNDSQALGFDNNAWLAGLQLTWNIFQGNEVHNKLATQKLEQQQVSLQLTRQKELDTRDLAKAALQLKEADYRLAQYQAATGQAQESLYILQNRYQQGLAGTTDLLQAQTQVAQQKLLYKQAVMMHNSTLSYIRFLTAH